LAGVKIDGETISLDKDGANATAVNAANANFANLFLILSTPSLNFKYNFSPTPLK
jgi:hypothetical protein